MNRGGRAEESLFLLACAGDLIDVVKGPPSA